MATLLVSGVAVASSLSGRQARDATRIWAIRDCQRTKLHTEAKCFRWRISKCVRRSSRRIDCQVVKYLRPGESNPEAIQVCRYWVYVRSGVAQGGWHYECNDRVPQRRGSENHRRGCATFTWPIPDSGRMGFSFRCNFPYTEWRVDPTRPVERVRLLMRIKDGDRRARR